jgi:uncharacterized protein
MPEDAMREMVIDSIRVSIVNYQQRVVILRVKESNRYLPIWIGPTEADAIAFKLQDVAAPRPLTHDLLKTVISTLGAEVKRILVSDLNNDTFYAKIILQVNDAELEVDSRPSDAIALAVRTDAPIFAHDDVIEKAGVEMDEEGRPVQTEIGEDAAEPVKEEELKSLSAFTDFIETLNLDDLGKGEIPPSSEPSSPEGTT